jgi:hypothetical protein
VIALGFHDGLPTPAWQGWVLFGVWVAGFLVPALFVARDARRRDAAWVPWFVLTLFASLLGVMQYYMDKRITARKAREAEEASRPR